MQKQFTTSQVWLVHSLEGIGMGAVVIAALSFYSAFQSGSLSTAGVAVAAAVGGVVSKGVSGIIANPQTVQAVEDSGGQLKEAVTTMLGSHNVLLNMFNAFLQQNAQQTAAIQQHLTTLVQSTQLAQASATPAAQAPIEAQPTQSVPAVPPAPQAAPIAPPFSLPTFSSAMPAMPRQ